MALTLEEIQLAQSATYYGAISWGSSQEDL